MSYALRRVVLIACCVLAVVVAGSFLPAAGYGDYPDSAAVDESYYADGGDAAAPDGGSTDDGGNDAENGTADEPTSPAGNETDDEQNETEDEDSDETDGNSSEDRDDTRPRDDEDDDEGSILAPMFPSLGALVVVGGLVLAFWRATSPDRVRRRGHYAGEIPTGFLPRLRFRLAMIPQVTMLGTIAVSRRVPSLVDTAAGTGRSVGAVVADLGRGFGTAVATLGTSAGRTIGGLGAVLSFSGGFATLFSGLRGRSWSLPSVRSGRAAGTSTAGRGSTAESEPEPERPPETVEDAWTEMVDAVAARRRRVRTPGEYARLAIERGLPAKPVGTLTTLFREVRYGGASASADRRRRALEAYRRIERAIASDGDGSEGDADGSSDRGTGPGECAGPSGGDER